MINRKGFTLLEILLVIAIIGFSAFIVIPRLEMGQTAILKAQVREAIAVLNYARRAALIQGKPQIAILYETEETAASEPGRWVSQGASLQWGGEKAKDSKEYRVTFYPEGGSSGGEIVVARDGYEIKIVINPLTGKIKSVFPDET